MPYELVARSSHAWLVADHPGAPELGPYRLPDGRDAYDLIDDGDTDHLGFTPRFVRQNGTRLGDLVWSTGSVKIASDRFVAALTGFDGWKRFTIRAETSRGVEIPGYSGFAVVPGGTDVFLTSAGQNEAFGVSDDVMAALRDAGATEYKAKRITT